MSSAPIHDLLARAQPAGADFRLWGAQVWVQGRRLLPPDLLSELSERKAEVWDCLGGTRLDQPSLDLIARHFPTVRLVVPRTEAEAVEAVAQIEVDADRFAKGLIGFDIETQANPGEEIRQPVLITPKGVVQRPALDPEHLRRPSHPQSTAGLDPHRSNVRLAQLYGGGDAVLVLDTKLVTLSALAPVLHQRKLVIHNASFELAFLHHAGLPLPRYECTMQAGGLLLGTQRRGLDDVTRHFLHLDLPKELQTSDWGAPVLSPGQLAYAALDAIVALELWPLLYEGIKQGYADAYVLQRAAIAPTVKMQARGLMLDQAAHEAEIDKWSLHRAEAHKQLIALLGEPPPDTPAKIRNFLERVLPAEVLAVWPRTSKSNELSTADKALKRVAGVPALDLVRVIKTQEKLLGSFGVRLAAKVSTDGRLRASFNLAGAKTGRMRCSSPNLQNFPRDIGFRDCFVAAPGHVLIVGDYSSMELRAAAEISDDVALRRDFANGVDLHRRLAAQMHGIAESAVTREQRQSAKPINFGTIYGAGGNGLAASAWASYGILMSPAEAQAARDRFLGRYRQLAAWMRTHADSCQRKGIIQVGRYGRIIRAEWEGDRGSYQRSYSDGEYDGDDYDDANGYEDADLAAFYNNADQDQRSNYTSPPPPSQLKYTLCCNVPIQGACADVGMLAMVLLDKVLTGANIPGGLVLVVHDEFVIEVPDGFADAAKQLLEQAMTKAFSSYFPLAPTSGLVEAHVCATWGESKP